MARPAVRVTPQDIRSFHKVMDAIIRQLGSGAAPPPTPAKTSAARSAKKAASNDTEQQKRAILGAVARVPNGLKAPEISERTGIPLERVKALLPVLRDEKLLRSKGKTRGTLWSKLR